MLMTASWGRLHSSHRHVPRDKQAEHQESPQNPDSVHLSLSDGNLAVTHPTTTFQILCPLSTVSQHATLTRGFWQPDLPFRDYCSLDGQRKYLSQLVFFQYIEDIAIYILILYILNLTFGFLHPISSFYVQAGYMSRKKSPCQSITSSSVCVFTFLQHLSSVVCL